MAIVKATPFRPMQRRPRGDPGDPYSKALRTNAPVQIDPYQYPNGGLNDVGDDAGGSTGINATPPSLGARGTSYLAPGRNPLLVNAGYPYNQFTDDLGDAAPLPRRIGWRGGRKGGGARGQLGDADEQLGDTGIALVDDVNAQIHEAAFYAKVTAGFAVAGGIFSALTVYFLWPRRRR